MSALERELQALAVALELPPTPNLVAAAEARFGAAPRRSLRPLAVALVAIVLAAAVAVALSPSARSSFLELFHLRGATVERLEKLPVLPVTGTLDLGERVGLAEAERRAGPLVRLDLRDPDEVWIRRGAVTMVYGAPHEIKLLFSQFPGSIEESFVKKVIGSGTRIDQVLVGSSRGLWLEGNPHFFVYRDPGGSIRSGRAYLAGNTLLWERDGRLLRLEGALTKGQALELARDAH